MRDTQLKRAFFVDIPLFPILQELERFGIRIVFRIFTCRIGGSCRPAEKGFFIQLFPFLHSFIKLNYF